MTSTKSAEDKQEKSRNDAAKESASLSVIGADGRSGALASGLDGVPAHVLNPAYVVFEETANPKAAEAKNGSGDTK